MRFPLLIVGILGGVIPAVAQHPSPPTFGDSMVVTASLESEKEKQLPASVDVITADEIQARQKTEVAELLRTVAGLTVVRSGSPGQVTSLFTRGAESDHTLVLWNGIELNDPFFGGFNWTFLPTEGVERIEIVRGPFSSLYGADALGGVVQIVTAARDGGVLRLEGGEDGYLRGALSAGQQWGSARVEVSGHLRRGDGQLENDFYDSEEIVARSEWRLGAGSSLGFVVRGNNSETGIPLSGGSPSPNRTISWKERQVAIPFRVRLGNWKVNAQASWVDYDNSFRDPDDPFGFTASDTESESRRARAVATYLFDGDLWVAFGSDYDRAEVSDRSVFGINLNNESQKNWGLFGEVFYQVGKATLDLGLRQDDNDAFGSETSPRLGLLYTFSDQWRVRGSYGQGFRAPSIGELFFPLTGNPELEPETSESWELAVEFSSDGWSWSVTGFENNLENLIDFDFASFKNFNVGRAQTQGVELEVGYRRDLVAVRWNGTYVETEDLGTGLALLRRPEKSSNLVTTFSPNGWVVNLTAIYVGERDDVDPVTFGRSFNESHVRLDVAAQWQATATIAPYARVENVADEEYSEALGFPAPGRTLVGGLALRF